MKIPIIIRDRLYIPRIPDYQDLYESIRRAFTYRNPEYSKRRGLGLWTGNVHKTIETWSYDTRYGDTIVIPRGGIDRIRKIFKDFELQPSFIDQRVSLTPINNLYNDITLREDQIRLAKAMFKVQNCLIRSPTGSGKTEVALKVIEWILKDAGNVLVIVWEKDLMDEWITRASKRFGLRKTDIGILGGGHKKKIAPITVGMQQTLRNCIDQYTMDFGGIIADEVQRFAAKTFQDVISFVPAKYRIGISADETRKDGMEFLIYDMFGNVAEEIERATLIEQGKIHDVVIRIIPTEYDFEVQEGMTWNETPRELKNFKELLDNMCYDPYRNKVAWSIIKPNLDEGHTVLIITHRVNHAIWFDKHLRSNGYKCGLMIGGKQYEQEFKDTKRGLRSGTLQAGIGTVQKIGQSLDIPRWDRGIILTPTAGNKQQFEQIIGRLRRPFKGKKDAICYYIWDKYIYPGHKNKLSKYYKNVFLYDDGGFVPV